jgi:hypothetical protein
MHGLANLNSNTNRIWGKMVSRAGPVALEARETSVPVDNRMQIRRYYSPLSSEFTEWSTDAEHIKFMSQNKYLSIKLKLLYSYVKCVQLNQNY